MSCCERARTHLLFGTKIMPMKSAPAFVAMTAESGSCVPQIFTSGFTSPAATSIETSRARSAREGASYSTRLVLVAAPAWLSRAPGAGARVRAARARGRAQTLTDLIVHYRCTGCDRFGGSLTRPVSTKSRGRRGRARRSRGGAWTTVEARAVGRAKLRERLLLAQLARMATIHAEIRTRWSRRDHREAVLVVAAAACRNLC